ncbi:MAG: hypothetical protein WCZ21_03190 [Bacteroidales bacterium]|jgi:hypothetical protein
MKKTGLIIILLVSACVVKAQRESVIQNIVLSDPVIDSSKIDPYLHIDPIKTCHSTLKLHGEFHSTQEYDATLNGLTIQTGNKITVSNATFHEGSNYTLTAGDRIVFQSGTKIEAGAVDSKTE